MTSSNPDSKTGNAFDRKPRMRPRRRSARIHYMGLGKDGILMESQSQETYRFEPIPESVREVLYK